MGRSGHSLRIVVQYIHAPQGSFYRLVAYGDSAAYRPVELASRAQLVKTLRQLVTDLDESEWPEHENLRETRIIFSADVTVDESQLRLAGLIPGG